MNKVSNKSNKVSLLKSTVAYKVKSEVWIWPGMAGWHFVSVPKKTSEEIKVKFGARAAGWGSLPVRVTLGQTTWNTSIFPDKKSGTYLLPLKASVRKTEGILAQDRISLALEIRA